jgi:hypothetical protein
MADAEHAGHRMTWIRVHARLIDRPVVGRLVEALRVRPAAAVGYLVTLWGSISQHAEAGRIGALPDAQIERWAGWDGKRGAFAKWLRATHLDELGRPREWEEYQGALDRQREADRERRKRFRTRDVPRDIPRDIPTTPGVTSEVRHAATKRNETKDTTAPPTPTARAREAPSDDIAVTLTVAANQAVTARFGESDRPLLASSAAACDLAEWVTALAIPPEFAAASIVRQVGAKADTPPGSMAYFRKGIAHDWATQEARAQAAGRPPVMPLDRSLAAQIDALARARPELFDAAPSTMAHGER